MENEKFIESVADKIMSNALKDNWYIDRKKLKSQIMTLMSEMFDRAGGDLSDGYHTFDELYRYRKDYNAAFFNLLAEKDGFNVHKSHRHNDGEKCFGGGWFIVMADLPTGQISNHYEDCDWDLFKVEERERADKWDGHSPKEAADRLEKYIKMM